eukprot:Polyplicarium_translucidae@DN320_c0_g1_i2.p1
MEARFTGNTFSEALAALKRCRRNSIQSAFQLGDASIRQIVSRTRTHYVHHRGIRCVCLGHVKGMFGTCLGTLRVKDREKTRSPGRHARRAQLRLTVRVARVRILHSPKKNCKICLSRFFQFFFVQKQRQNGLS